MRSTRYFRPRVDLLEPRHLLHALTPSTLAMAVALPRLPHLGVGIGVGVAVAGPLPTLQADVDAFDRLFGLPAIRVPILQPLGTPSPATDVGWQVEAALDVEVIHALAPAARI